MTDAPERIWAVKGWEFGGEQWLCGSWDLNNDFSGDVEYIRADAIPLSAALAHPAVRELVELLERTVAMIARGKSIEKQAARLSRKGGSATPVLWAAEAYDVLLDDLDRDARATLARLRAAGGAE